VPPNVVADTGPIVALLDADEVNHDWVMAQLRDLQPPLLACEAVLTEASFLLRRGGGDPTAVADLVARGLITVMRLFDDDAEAIARLMRRYAKVPMSLADACIVRMVERTPHATVLTLDSDFRVYRHGGRRVIPLLMP
jgi:predicted nucleic acid-binding protein